MDELVFKQIRCRAHLKCVLDSPGNVLYAGISICCINGWTRALSPPANKSPARADAVTQAATLPKQIPGFSYILLEKLQVEPVLCQIDLQ